MFQYLASPAIILKFGRILQNQFLFQGQLQQNKLRLKLA